MRYELKMKKLIAEGRVTPGELAAFEQARKERQDALAIAFQDFVQRTLAYRGQRVMLLGHTATAFQLAAKGQAMGEEGIFAHCMTRVASKVYLYFKQSSTRASSQHSTT
jgi:hypothetical protein